MNYALMRPSVSLTSLKSRREYHSEFVFFVNFEASSKAGQNTAVNNTIITVMNIAIILMINKNLLYFFWGISLTSCNKLAPTVTI